MKRLRTPPERSRAFTPIKSRRCNSQLCCIKESHQPTNVPLEGRAICQSLYEQWSCIKVRLFRLKSGELKEREGKIAEEKEKEKLTKLNSSKTVYDAWKSQKKVIAIQKMKQERSTLEKKLNEERERGERIKDGQQAFKVWKKKKDEDLAYQMREMDLERRIKIQDLVEDKRRKEDAQSVFNAWKRQKDEELNGLLKTMVEERLKLKNAAVAERKQREADATSAFEAWLAMKEQNRETQEYTNINRKKKQQPWYPSGIT